MRKLTNQIIRVVICFVSSFMLFFSIMFNYERVNAEVLETNRLKSNASMVACGINEANIIKILHNGNNVVMEQLEKELSQVADNNFEALDQIASKYFKNDNIMLVRNSKLAKNWIRNWLKVVTVFPDLIGVVKLTADRAEHPAGAPNTSSEASLNEIIHYNCLTNTNVDAKTKQVKNYNRNYTIVHELGHVIDALLFGSANEQVLTDAYERIPLQNKGTLLQEIEKMSKYASEQSSDDIIYSEAFAEAITDVVINGEDASDLAKETIKLLVRQKPNKEWLHNVREWGMI